MKIAAIVAEYNPFHNGHLYQINYIKEKLKIDHIMVVMSGSLVQRGDLAIANKYDRATLAVENGVSLVVELPAYFSIQSAENFALGALDIINKSRVIDYLVFGSESRLEDLEKIIRCIRDNKLFYNEKIKTYIKDGLSYKTSFTRVLFDLGLDIALGPNDTLAIEYLKNLQDSSIKPYAIKRHMAHHQSLTSSSTYASGSFIRRCLIDGKIEDIRPRVPNNSFELLKSLEPDSLHSLDSYFDILKYKALIMRQDFSKIKNYENGMGNLIRDRLQKSDSMEELIEKSKSSRYNRSRISRFILAYLLDLYEEDVNQANFQTYLRPLAFDSRGLEILSMIKRKSSLPILGKFASAYKASPNILLDFELKASNLYNLFSNSRINEDFYRSVIKKE